MGGPSFKPAISPEALEGLSMKGDGMAASPPRDQARRSLYMYSKRGLLAPIMTTFDFCDTTQPCGRRDFGFEASQALALLNGVEPAGNVGKLLDEKPVHFQPVGRVRVRQQVVDHVVDPQVREAER